MLALIPQTYALKCPYHCQVSSSLLILQLFQAINVAFSNNNFDPFSSPNVSMSNLKENTWTEL